MKSLAERFVSKVKTDARVMRVPLSPCDEWTGAQLPKGYGKINAGGRRGRTLLAHRVAKEIALGRALLPSEQVLHHCDNPPCVKDAHTFIGTEKDNKRDMMAKGRHGYTAHHGSANGSAKLDDKRVLEARERLARGERQADIAASLGVGQTTISRIYRGESWSE